MKDLSAPDRVAETSRYAQDDTMFGIVSRMELALIILGVASLCEGLLWVRPFWRLRIISGTTTVLLLLASSLIMLTDGVTLLLLLLALLSAYRLINIGRVMKGRSHDNYLVHMGRQASLWLIGAQLALVLTAKVSEGMALSGLSWLYALAVLQLAGAVVLLTSTLRHARTTRPVGHVEPAADRDLPTLTVAIPARNETTSLERCIQSLLASDYPKLEVLVLDDCSQNTRTPEIIKQFAQKGVRFLAGKVPPADWLAKNYAYQQLAAEASGKLVLFCGADTRFSPKAIRQLVLTLQAKQKTMLSVLPRNEITSGTQLLLQPTRYAWEISLPRRLFNRPPVLSTCWLIEERALQAAGGFKAVKRAITPEAYFAKYAASHRDGYSFIRSTPEALVSSNKSAEEQQATAVRTRYPQLHRRIELVPLLAGAELGLLVLPFTMAIAACLAGIWPLATLLLLAALCQTAVYLLVARLTYGLWLTRGLLLVPFAALYDVALIHYSMWRYEFKQVIWKDRNVCIPVMRVVSQLPKLD